MSGFMMGVRPSLSLTGGAAHDVGDGTWRGKSQIKAQLLSADIQADKNTVSVVPGVVIDGTIDRSGLHTKVGFDLDIRIAESIQLPVFALLAPRTYSVGAQVFNDKARLYTGVDFRLPVGFSGALSVGPSVGYTQPYAATPGSVDVGIGVKGSLDLLLGLFPY